MEKDFSCTASHGKLLLSGRFDMDAHGVFRHACRQQLAGGGDRPLHLDLGGVDYIDTSALGMLLILKKESEGQGRQVVLANCPPVVRGILKTANFDRLFTVAAA